MLVRTLSSAGYDCYESDSGAETLKLVHAEQPSLVILDFDMPGLDGAEVLKVANGHRFNVADLELALSKQRQVIVGVRYPGSNGDHALLLRERRKRRNEGEYEG